MTPLPDPTAVLVALWRGMHLVLDDPPHVLVDDVGMRIADHKDALGAAGLPVDGWQEAPAAVGAFAAMFRPEMVARARFTEDVVGELVAAGEAEQYVVLGAGLDTFALRRPELVARLSIYEIDQPGPQAWKQERLAELGIALPDRLRFVPVDFETGEVWTDRLAECGFEPERPTVLSALGLTQYITGEAISALFRTAAGLGPGTTLVCSFIVPDALVDPAELEVVTALKQALADRGCPKISFYTPGQIVDVAARAGFGDIRYVSPPELSRRYLAGRSDGLHVPSAEQLLVARRS